MLIHWYCIMILCRHIQSNYVYIHSWLNASTAAWLYPDSTIFGDTLSALLRIFNFFADCRRNAIVVDACKSNHATHALSILDQHHWILWAVCTHSAPGLYSMLVYANLPRYLHPVRDCWLHIPPDLLIETHLLVQLAMLKGCSDLQTCPSWNEAKSGNECFNSMSTASNSGLIVHRCSALHQSPSGDDIPAIRQAFNQQRLHICRMHRHADWHGFSQQVGIAFSAKIL